MSLIRLGFWAASGAGGLSYWLSTLGGASSDQGHSVGIDSLGNNYSLGFTFSTGAGNPDAFLAKRDVDGAVQWQRTLGGTNYEKGFSLVIDSSNNIYEAGFTFSEGAGGDLLLAKYNSSGTLQWQRILGGSSEESGEGITSDSAGNVYVFGYSSSQGAGAYDLLLAKYNSSGALQWQRILGGSGNEFGRGISIDSSDNLYVLGTEGSEGSGSSSLLLAKYNSSGTIQWQRILAGSGADRAAGVSVDSSNNIYVLGHTESQGAGGRDLLLAKYNSSGTIQWQRILGGSGGDEGNSVHFDSSDNVYVLGITASSGEGNKDYLLAKYNSSGTIQWQRTLGGSAADEGISIKLDSLGAIYALGFTASTGEGSDDLLLAKLPSDGSLTGTYTLDGVDIVYAPSSLTAATSTLTSSTSTLTAATSTLTTATSTLTDASASLTSHIVEF